MTTRVASHAGSWYSSNKSTLSSELDGWLSQVDPSINGQPLPIPGARVIIAPHAGYSYSGPAAAWAYASLDLSHATRIFLLGPSHHHYLSTLALSRHAFYATPLGPLQIDRETTEKLAKEGNFEWMSSRVDEEEHSLEMHLPYIYKMLERSGSKRGLGVKTPIVPIMVGNTDVKTEERFGEVFGRYLRDEGNVFIVSSDFCHWGSRFSYTYYIPSISAKGTSLSKRDPAPTSPTLAESITLLDRRAMDAISSGSHNSFVSDLAETGNTVCGRHPIGVVMAALAFASSSGEREEGEEGKGKFKFVRYERSSDPVDMGDSSVSYASAYAVI